MRSMRRLLILRMVVVVVVSALAIVAFISGEAALGALMTAFAATNVVLIVIFARGQARSGPTP